MATGVHYVCSNLLLILSGPLVLEVHCRVRETLWMLTREEQSWGGPLEAQSGFSSLVLWWG